jgi:hypothetical protein
MSPHPDLSDLRKTGYKLKNIDSLKITSNLYYNSEESVCGEVYEEMASRLSLLAAGYPITEQGSVRFRFTHNLFSTCISEKKDLIDHIQSKINITNKRVSPFEFASPVEKIYIDEKNKQVILRGETTDKYRSLWTTRFVEQRDVVPKFDTLN